MDIRIHFILEFLEQNSDKQVSLAKLAFLVDLSGSRLRHLFTHETGKSPREYLRDLRLSQAQRLLAETKLSIDQVALRVGWQERSHFERTFKQRYGVTPSHFRSTMRFSTPTELVSSQSRHRLAAHATSQP